MFIAVFSITVSLNSQQQGKDENKNVGHVKNIYKTTKKYFIIMETLKSF